MWLFSKTGFLSIVKHRYLPGKLLVRARTRDDLQQFLNVVDVVGGGRHEIKEDRNADYRYRSVVSQKSVAEAVSKLVSAIDYDNFKNAVHGEPRRDAAYMKVWAAMHALQFPEAPPLPELDDEWLR